MRRLDTPLRLQRYLDALPYNREARGPTWRSFRGVVASGTAHCGEAALFAAVVLEAHGHPPVVLSIDSVDGLGHVVALYRRNGRWGGVARSRDPGLHGRKAVFRSVRDLVWSYFDPYIDFTGEITGYAVVDLRALPLGEWRLATGNVWRVERALIDAPHVRLRGSRARVRAWRRWYRAWMAAHPGEKPAGYPGRRTWLGGPG